MINRSAYLSSIALALLAIVPAHAQAPPDAGALRQDIEGRRRPVEPNESAPAPVTETSTAAAAPAGPSVTVAAFRFTGNTLLNAEQLSAALEAFLKKPLSFEELQKAVAAVADAYRHEGWVVRAYLPLQEIKDGIVTIAVVEAIFGETRLEGTKPERVPFERLNSMVSGRQKKGELLNATKLDRALLLINELAGVTASGHLVAGSLERSTDLMLKVQDDPLLSGEAIADNAGSRSTGEARVIATAYLNSPLRMGDQFAMTLLHADGLDYARLQGMSPVGSNGFRIGAHASHLKYELVAPEFESLAAEGTSTEFGLDTSFALIRSRTQSLSLSLYVDTAKFENESFGSVTTEYTVSTANLGASGYRFDGIGGGGVSVAALTLVYGKADLTDSPNRLADAATTQVNGGFAKLNYFASRQQQITERISVYGAVRGQLASGNLDSSEKFYLGGVAGVRAYPASEGGGDQGMLVTAEGRMRLPMNFNVAAFYDWGSVTVNRHNDFIGAATLNSFNLQGVGTSVAWATDFGFSLNVVWARRLGDNPNATITGNDQDGTLKKNRFWLRVALSF